MPQILVIDDDAALRRAVGRALQREGYEVREAGNGLEAMRAIESEMPELILTDINMPEMDGIEVVMTLRQRHPKLPVVAMSGGGIVPKEILLKNAGALGAVALIAKPFELSHLLETIQQVLANGGSARAGVDE